MTIRIRSRLALCSGLLLAALLAVACSSSSKDDGQTVKIKLTSAGCEPAELTLPAGQTTFEVTNDGAAGVTEFEIMDGNHIIGEVENVAPGLTRKFSMKLTPGSFVSYCPGATNEKGTLTVTGAAEPTPTASGPETTLKVSEKDYAIGLPQTEAPAGRFTFVISNEGPTTHEFVIVKTDLAAGSLPVENDEVNEDDSRLQHIDEVEDVKAGDSASFTVDLPAGHYAFICNITAHYGLGMHADFTVK
jgi:uncharacterized cupredoxin-like copper-binding protein